MQTLTLENRYGDQVELTDFGARVMSMTLNTGSATTAQRRNIVLGLHRPEDYGEDPYKLGCIVGRCCNRVRNATFVLGGETVRLDRNHGKHHIHGGSNGFNLRTWKIDDHSDTNCTLSLVSPHGDQGYPGNLNTTVCYSWRDQRVLRVDMQATSDRPTHVNLTSHLYFNLDGGGTNHDHRLAVRSRRITAVDDDLVPTGEYLALDGTALDLRSSRRVGDILESDHSDVRKAGGLDFNYVLEVPSEAAVLTSGDGRITMQLATSLPGLQVYSAQHLPQPFSGICLEPQFFPDSPNHADFPSTLVTPDSPYRHWVEYQFASR